MGSSTKITSVIKSLLTHLRTNASAFGMKTVYDYVPEQKDLTFFVVLGEVSTKDDGTKFGHGEFITIDIEIWSKNKGKYKDLLVAKKIQELLENELVPLPEEEDFIVISQQANDIVSRELEYGNFLTILQLKIRIQ